MPPPLLPPPLLLQLFLLQRKKMTKKKRIRRRRLTRSWKRGLDDRRREARIASTGSETRVQCSEAKNKKKEEGKKKGKSGGWK